MSANICGLSLAPLQVVVGISLYPLVCNGENTDRHTHTHDTTKASAKQTKGFHIQGPTVSNNGLSHSMLASTNMNGLRSL